MKLKKILALLTILLLTLTACKSTEDPVVDKKPLKLSERAGTYTCVDVNTSHSDNIIDMVIGTDGSVKIDNIPFPNLEPTSTTTSFIVSVQNANYTIDFSTNRLTGAEGSSDNNIYSFSKKI